MGGRWVFHDHFHLDSSHVMCKGPGWLSESGWSLGPAPRGAPPPPATFCLKQLEEDFAAHGSCQGT